MPSIAELLIEQGRQEGLQEARDEYVGEVLRPLLRTVLGQRFGLLEASVGVRIDAAELDEIKEAFSRVIAAEDAASIFVAR